MQSVNKPKLKLTTPVVQKKKTINTQVEPKIAKEAKKQSKEKTPTKTGVILWYKKDKGYGFIKPDDNSKEVFLHYKELKKINLENIESETKVSFKTKEENNKVQACNILILGISRKKAEQVKKRDVAVKVLNILISKYPKTFGYKPKPLAIGISQELFAVAEELGLPKTELRTFFSFYCRSKEYREMLVVKAERVDLKGEVRGIVTEEEATYYLK